MAIDTGATYTIIPIETAIAVGYNPAGSRTYIEITTANGVVISPIINFKSICCLVFYLNNIKVLCHDIPSQSPVKGLLGLNFLVYFEPFRKFLKEIQRLQLKR
jgi:predicted aspartyl protease